MNRKSFLSGTIISSTQKNHTVGQNKSLIRMHTTCERIHSAVSSPDLLQVKEVKASFLVGWALGNEVKNEFVQEGDKICPNDRM